MTRPRARANIEAHLREHNKISVEGRMVPVQFIESPHGQPPHWDFHPRTDTLLLNLNGSTQRERLLKGMLREVAEHAIIPRSRQLAKECHLRFTIVNIRDQRSRWGSCSAHKALSFNWRLILLPAHLHDYVIYHELAHLRHFNHSAKFWSFLNELDPKSEEHDKELTTMSQTIIPLGLGLK